MALQRLLRRVNVEKKIFFFKMEGDGKDNFFNEERITVVN